MQREIGEKWTALPTDAVGQPQVRQAPRIGIGFYGLPRASDVTFPTIIENIIEPASRLGELCIRYHLYLQNHVFNPSTHENSPLDATNYSPFKAFEGVLEQPDGVPESHGFDAIKQHGDAWNNDFISLRNLLLQLHSLHNVTRQLLAADPDIVVFARPDLLYHDTFAGELAAALQDNASVTRLPAWQWCGGYNDRFCIAGRQAIVPYGQRLEAIDRYFDLLGRPLQSERLLRFALDTAGIRIHPINLRASRVRVGGLIQPEKFGQAAVARRIRWKARELLKSWLLRV